MLSYRREIRLGLETWRLVLSLGLRAKVRGHTTENQLCNAPVPRDGAALDAASRGDDALAAEIVALGVFEASQRRRAALLAWNVTKNWKLPLAFNSEERHWPLDAGQQDAAVA